MREDSIVVNKVIMLNTFHSITYKITIGLWASPSCNLREVKLCSSYGNTT
jgi:hypothetical protein